MLVCERGTALEQVNIQLWVLVGPAGGPAVYTPYMVIIRRSKQRCRKGLVTRGSKRSVASVVDRRPLLSFAFSHSPSGAYSGSPHFGLIDVPLLFIWISPSPRLPLSHFLLSRCPQRQFAVLPPLRTILPPHRRAPLGNIAVSNPTTLSQRCQLNPPHFIPPTHPPPLPINKRSSIF